MAEHDAHYLIIGSEQYNFRDDTKLPADNPEATGDFTVEGDIYFNEEADSLSTQLSGKANAADLADVATTGDYDDLINKPTIPTEASDLTYDNTYSEIPAANVQEAIDEIYLEEVTQSTTKMEKNNPRGTGSLAMNVSPGATVGADAVVLGTGCSATGNQATAKGYQTTASGSHSSAEGYWTEAASFAQHVSGKFNVVDNNGDYVEIIGIGADDNNRSNGRTLDWNGNETIAGDLYFNGGVDPLSTQLAAKADASALPGSYQQDNTATPASVASGTSYSNICQISITPGYWLVNWGTNFGSNGSGNVGHRGGGVGDSSSGAPLVNLRQSVPCVTQDNYTALSGGGIYYTSTNKTLYLKARHTAGTGINLDVDGRLQAIKVMGA